MKAAIFVGLLTLASAAHAADDSKLWSCGSIGRQCSTPEAPGYNICAGFVAGFNNAAGAFETARPICAPSNGSVRQMAAVVGKWVEEHPEHWHEPVGYCVLGALITAFPCPAK